MIDQQDQGEQMDLFAAGHKSNPETQAQKEDRERLQAFQRTENERMQREMAEFAAKRAALKATMTAEEWQKFLQEETAENAKKFEGASGAWVR